MDVNRWTDKLWYVHTMKYYSAMKKEGATEKCNGVWTNLKTPLLNQGSKEKNTHCIVPFT